MLAAVPISPLTLRRPPDKFVNAILIVGTDVHSRTRFQDGVSESLHIPSLLQALYQKLHTPHPTYSEENPGS